MKKQQSGFTLIELVVVIVVLGILAAVAFPRLGTVSDDAKKAVTEAYMGAVGSAGVIKFASVKAPSTLAVLVGQTVSTDQLAGFTSSGGGSVVGNTVTAAVCNAATDTVLTGTYTGVTFNAGYPAPTITIPKELCSG